MIDNLPSSLALVMSRKEGGFDAGNDTLDATLAGAVLADLALQGLVELVNGNVVAPSGRQDPTDPVLADAVVCIRQEAKPRDAAWWVSELRGNELREQVLNGLVADGALAHETKKVLGLFSRDVYRTADEARAESLRGHLRHVLDGSAPADARDALIIALLDASGSLRPRFGRDSAKAVSQQDPAGWAPPAVAQVLKEVQSAISAAVTVSTVAAATSSGS